MAIFGKDTDGAADWNFSANSKYGTIFTLPVDATITKLSILCNSAFAAGEHLNIVIYDVTGGEPIHPVAVSESIEGDGTKRWYHGVAGDLPKTLSAGQYWLGGICDSAAGYRYAVDASYKIKGKTGDAPPPDDPFGTPQTWDGFVLSVYATYTPAAPPAVGGATKSYLVLTL